MVYSIETTNEYDKWFTKLKDGSGKIKILARLARVENGNFGDHKRVLKSICLFVDNAINFQ